MFCDISYWLLKAQNHSNIDIQKTILNNFAYCVKLLWFMVILIHFNDLFQGYFCFSTVGLGCCCLKSNVKSGTAVKTDFVAKS